MNRQRIQKAEAEAERFLSRIADLMDKAKEVGDFSAIECGSLESGALRRYVNFYVDGDECRTLDGLDTPVDAATEVMIIPSVAGG